MTGEGMFLPVGHPSALTREVRVDTTRRSEADEHRLKRVCQEFESLFLAYLMKVMRQTIPRREEEKGLGRSYFESMFDEAVARKISRTRSMGLSDILYRQLSDAQSPPPKTVGGFRNVERRDMGDRSAFDRIRRYEPMILSAARRYGVDPDLIKAVILHESGAWPRAVSPAGALGLMQLLPETAEMLDVKDPLDPRQNIFGGTRHLRVLLNRFDGDLERALASYNAGTVAVERHEGVPPFPETRHFVDRVLEYFRIYKDGLKDRPKRTIY